MLLAGTYLLLLAFVVVWPVLDGSSLHGVALHSA